jgi:hypothetical protein
MANRMPSDWPSLNYRRLNAGSAARKRLVAHPYDRLLTRGTVQPQHRERKRAIVHPLDRLLTRAVLF